MQRRVLVACVRRLNSSYLESFLSLLSFFPQEKRPLAFDLIDRLLREGCKVVVVGDLQIDSSRNLKSMSNLFNLELTKLVPLDLSPQPLS
jgi:hypothetical protein